MINCWWRSRNDFWTLRAITVPTPMFLCSHSHPYLNPIPVGIPFPWELPFPRTPPLLAGSLHTTHSAAGNVFLVASEICGWTSYNRTTTCHPVISTFDVDIIHRWYCRPTVTVDYDVMSTTTTKAIWPNDFQLFTLRFFLWVTVTQKGVKCLFNQNILAGFTY